MQLLTAAEPIDLSVPVVMGILNVTPDSFSDGGKFIDSDAALRQAERMADEGAAIIDVGGESTRPGAARVSEQTEIDRVAPVIEAIAARLPLAVSVDTSKPAVMRAAVAAGATMLNDVYALRQEGALEEAARLDAAVCLMHMQGEPRTMQENPRYIDVAAEVAAFLSERIRRCIEAGIARERIAVDPGFGFGKTDAHNLELLANLGRIRDLGAPLLVGWSRKSTLGKLTGRPVEGRLAAGIAAAVLAVERGAHIVRTHDVCSTVDALKVAIAVMRARVIT
ncbi:MAG TPA: dihydropteroate synthase [Woeseiaceae bacterium]|nr:dihydropteroate synthase [Woeseiaceae bacterium]